MKLRVKSFAVVAGSIAIFIFVLELMNIPPRFGARATFTINWNKIVTTDQNAKGDLNLQGFDKQLVHPIFSDEFISDLCNKCDLPNTESASVRQKLSRYLKVRRVGDQNDSTVYLVQFSDNDENTALNFVNFVSERMVAKMNSRAKLNSTFNALKSFGDNSEVQTKDEDARGELARLLQQENDYSADRAARIAELQGQLDNNDVDKMVTSFKALAGIAGIFSSPAESAQDGVVENSPRSPLPILAFRAVFWGACLGALIILPGRIFSKPKKLVPPVLH